MGSNPDYPEYPIYDYEGLFSEIDLNQNQNLKSLKINIGAINNAQASSIFLNFPAFFYVPTRWECYESVKIFSNRFLLLW